MAVMLATNVVVSFSTTAAAAVDIACLSIELPHSVSCPNSLNVSSKLVSPERPFFDVVLSK